MFNQFHMDRLIEMALTEDMNNGDITTEILIDKNQKSQGKFIAKEDGVIAGLEIVQRVFEKLDPQISFKTYKSDGELVHKQEVFAEIEGPTRAILSGERTALNLLQRLSGIATKTRLLVEEVKETKAKITDTRKTTAGLRVFEKYAVRVGGGVNHRFNLSESVLIKDNHIQAVGSIQKAIEKARENIPHTMKIEVEVETLEQLQEALEAKADIIMLDNMDISTMREAVLITDGKAILEASGNVSREKVKEIAQTGVDIISCGALTHSVKALDISLRF